MVFDLMQLFPQLPLTTLVPAWFYLFSGLIYLVVGIVSFLVSYFSFKLFRITSSKLHLVLSISFLLIGIAFGIITASSLYTYQNPESVMKIVDLNTDAYNIYYMLSIIAYLLLVIINLPKGKGSKLYTFVPVWFINSPNFHMTSILLLLYVAAKSVSNFFKIKSEESFLVMFAFLMIALSHIFIFLIPFGIELYLVAHVFLLAGFLSLLAMLVRVTRNDREKDQGRDSVRYLEDSPAGEWQS